MTALPTVDVKRCHSVARPCEPGSDDRREGLQAAGFRQTKPASQDADANAGEG